MKQLFVLESDYALCIMHYAFCIIYDAFHKNALELSSPICYYYFVSAKSFAKLQKQIFGGVLNAKRRIFKAA